MELCGKGVTFFAGLLFINGKNATMDDWQLLRNYAAQHSEEAFRSLVERYSGMVYHAALRQTGNPDSAEEAAQAVFIALAQKADRIPRQATLYGWLFRATRFAVLNQARQSANRQRREQEALAMQPTIEPNETDSIWERLTPHLNDALDSLSAADRELLMIRYFGNKSHKEAAEALGLSEETARKRLSRAMERLRETLAKRGVAVSSLALAAAFAANGAKAAPVEAASTWAEVAMAKAAAGAAAGSAGGILAFVTSAKVGGLLAALVLGGATFAIVKSISRGSLVAAPVATNLAIAQGATDANGSVTEPAAPPEPAGDAAAPAAALDKVKAALHDPNPTTVYPNAVMQEAIAGLGDKKKAALPILEASLNETDAQVRVRAMDGLGMIGPAAREVTPLLLDMLRAGGLGEANERTLYRGSAGPRADASFILGIEENNLILYTLGQVRPSPEILPELARIVKENPSARHILSVTLNLFSSSHNGILGGNWLWAIADGNSKLLNSAFAPLLQDPNPEVRRTAAMSLVHALGDQADAGVFPVAIELLRSGDDNFLRVDGLSLLEEAAADLNSTGKPTPRANDGIPAKPGLYAPRLGRYLNDTVAALGEVAYHTRRADLRLQASRMLDVLRPDFRKSDPQMAAELEQQDQSAGFAVKVQSGQATMPEILEGLKEFPKAAPAVGEFLVGRGSNAHQALAALGEALSSLRPPPEASGADRAEAIRMREGLANAMQKIAPELPKPIFTGSDVHSIMEILLDPAMRGESDRRERVSAARKLAEWPNLGPFDVSPDQVRRLLAAMNFSDSAVGSGKGN
jgi:RNA polymerase sigma factor (sigma-70 family)